MAARTSVESRTSLSGRHSTKDARPSLSRCSSARVSGIFTTLKRRVRSSLLLLLLALALALAQVSAILLLRALIAPLPTPQPYRYNSSFSPGWSVGALSPISRETTLANMSTTMREELGLESPESGRRSSTASRLDEASAASKCAREEVTRAPARPEGLARLVLHPHWRCRVAWDGLSTVFLLYNIVIVPFRLCFDSSARCPHPVWLLEAMIDWFFVLDIFVNFLTGVVCHTGLKPQTSRPQAGLLLTRLSLALHSS